MDKLSERQWKRLDVVQRLKRGELTEGEAARVLGVSDRQVRRIKARIEKLGRAGVVHGNSERAPANRLPEGMREKVLRLYWKYRGFNDTHFTEKLVEVEKLKLSRSTARRILREAGVRAVRGRRPPRHRKRRDRSAQAGLMILWDGSRHPWLEDRGPLLCLMGAVDDATGELLPGAHFLEQESAAGYLTVLLEIAREKGLPLSAYGDRHGALQRNDDHWTLEEELRGEQDPTQVGRALAALSIENIAALSPQAKGRVERLWGTLQDRLVSELRLANTRTLEEANHVLQRFRLDYNRRFAKAAAEATPAWRRVRPGTDLVRICSFYYEATVQNDNTVRVARHVIDIPPGPGKRGYAKVRVEVRQLLDGTWRVYQGDHLLATWGTTALAEARPLKRRKRSAASRAFRQAVTRIAFSLP